MLFLSIAQDYFLWHYTRAFAEIFHVWMNLLWFTIHFFSLPQLFKTWFSPFKRITEEHQKGRGFEEWIGSVIINLMSRMVGALMRSILILAGLASLLTVVVIGALTYLLWLVLPLLILGLWIAGITLFFI